MLCLGKNMCNVNLKRMLFLLLVDRMFYKCHLSKIYYNVLSLYILSDFFGILTPMTENRILMSPNVIVHLSSFHFVLVSCFMYFKDVLLKFIHRVSMFFWQIDSFIIIKCKYPPLAWMIFLVLTSSLSDVNIANQLYYDYWLHSTYFLSFCF